MVTGPVMRVSEVLERYGTCVELVPMDAHFGGISVGLYERDGVFTVWSFSGKPGVRDRLRAVRDQLVALGGLAAVDGTDNQVVFPCGYVHQRLIKFLVAQAVGKKPGLLAARGRDVDTGYPHEADDSGYG